MAYDDDYQQYDDADSVDEAAAQAAIEQLFGPDAAPVDQTLSLPTPVENAPAQGGNPFWLAGGDASGVPTYSPANPPPGYDPVAPAYAGIPTRDFSSLVAGTAPEPAPAGGPWLSFNPDVPYAIPDLADTPGGRRMEQGLGMVANLFGVGSGVASPGTAGGAYRDDWERRNPERNFDETVIDYRGSGIDTSGMERGGLPVVRVNSIAGTPIASEQFRSYGDLGSIPGRVPMRDEKGEPLLDAEGRTRRYDLPGWNGQQRFEPGLYPTNLPNGQTVYADRFNPQIFYGDREGRPDRLLVGGAEAQNFGRVQATNFGLTPTTDRRGNPVYYEAQSNRTWERSPSGAAGREIIDVNNRPSFRTGGGTPFAPAGGGGGRAPVRAVAPAARPAIGPNDRVLEGDPSQPGRFAVTSANGYVQYYERRADGSIVPVTGGIPLAQYRQTIPAEGIQGRGPAVVPEPKPLLRPGDRIVAGALDQPGNVADITSGNNYTQPYRYDESGRILPYGNPRYEPPPAAPPVGTPMPAAQQIPVLTPPPGTTIVSRNSAAGTVKLSDGRTVPAASLMR